MALVGITRDGDTPLFQQMPVKILITTFKKPGNLNREGSTSSF
ncbi:MULTISPECIES: hypothetical protein [unclassified Paenibacillus]|nr:MULTISPECIES: hypothetical protein [unclassified Paenibacillus]